MNQWSNPMNTRQHDHQPFAHSHRSHPVTLLSASVASADNAIIDAMELRVDIQLCAFHKWEAAGKPTGDGVQFWLEAEKELAAEKEDAALRGDSRDADRHGGIRHPHSLKM
jgi:hypothetical protein